MQEKSDKTGKKSKEINAELENLFKKLIMITLPTKKSLKL